MRQEGSKPVATFIHLCNFLLVMSHAKSAAMQTERVTKYVQSLDPSRLYNPASGWVDANVGDFIDMHKYVGPGAFNPTSTRASVLGEFGGLGLKVDQHQWIPEDSFSYEMQVSVHFALDSQA